MKIYFQKIDSGAWDQLHVAYGPIRGLQWKRLRPGLLHRALKLELDGARGSQELRGERAAHAPIAFLNRHLH